MQRKLLISTILISVCAASFAAGLRLFSYQNSDGQTIIVDRIERVPEQYRDQVTTGYIPSFRQPEKAGTDSSATTVVAPPPVSTSYSSKPSSSKITVIEPPPDIEKDPEVIKATSITRTIRELSSSLEKTYGLAATMGLANPTLSQLNLSNIHKLQNITQPATVNWEEAKVWKNQAIQIIGQLRTMFLTASRAIEQNSTQVLAELPDFIARVNHRISQLENMLKQAKEETKARLAQD